MLRLYYMYLGIGVTWLLYDTGIFRMRNYAKITDLVLKNLLQWVLECLNSLFK